MNPALRAFGRRSASVRAASVDGLIVNVVDATAAPASEMYCSVRFAGDALGLRRANPRKDCGLESRTLKTKFVFACGPTGSTTKPDWLTLAIASAATTGTVLWKTTEPTVI